MRNYKIAGHDIAYNSGNGKSAFEQFFKENPDVAIIDDWLTGMRGFDVARRILENKSNAKIILITEGIDEVNYLESHMVFTMKKPFDVNRLITLINQCQME